MHLIQEENSESSATLATKIRPVKRLALAFLALFPSCAFLPRSTPTPVALLEAGNARGKELVVFLPGRWSLISEFEREGFLKKAAKKWPEARLVAPDLHLGYYRNRSMAVRLHEDVVMPARKSGVTTLRIVGISMGGLGALIYDVEYPGQVDEVILLSPFLGENEALNEINSSGGIKQWKPGPIEEKDFSRKVWLQIREKWIDQNSRPKVLLGCGRKDKLASANRLFASSFLKPSEVIWQDGAHDWPTWRALFEELTR